MRRFILASTLVLASCAPRPQPVAAPEPLPAQPQVSAPPRGQLAGLTPTELVTRFGTPALQIREGTSLKLQFRTGQCVLDAYLYPTATGMRVTHVDARTLAGSDVDQAACIASLENPI